MAICGSSLARLSRRRTFSIAASPIAAMCLRAVTISDIAHLLEEDAVGFGIADARQHVEQIAAERRAHQQAGRAQAGGFRFGFAEKRQAGAGLAGRPGDEKALAD